MKSFVVGCRTVEDGAIAARSFVLNRLHLRYLRSFLRSRARARRREDLTPLAAHRLSDGTWPAAVAGAGVNVWATAVADQHTDDSRSRSENIRRFSSGAGSMPATGGFVACPLEVSSFGSAGPVRFNEVRLALGSRHGELGGADVHGADHTGASEEKRIDRWWRT